MDKSVTRLEYLLANFRWQPAIPAIVVLVITIMAGLMTHDPGTSPDSISLWTLLIPVGILASCGLAIASGFCSLFPQLAWIMVAAWAFKFTAAGPLPAYNRYVLLIGVFACVAMFVVQVWRVRSGRFTPTFRDAIDSGADEREADPD